jgi:diguanylate cyclase (GGDEF)-like protein/PAS domain S-box-containing protein
MIPWRGESLNLPDNSDTTQQRLMEDVLASVPEAVAVVRDSRVLYVNEAFTRIFGYKAAELLGGILQDFIVPQTRQKESARVNKDVDRFGFASLDTVRKNKDGGLVDVSLEAGPLMVNGNKAGYVISYRDVGERKRVEARLQHDALHDALTGLPNRALFLDRLSLAFTRRSRSRGQNCGVLFLDLDRFKEINDTLGHAAGDALLIAVAERLRGALRPQDTAARLGGDEFAILVESILSVSGMEIVATRVLEAMEREFEVCGHTIHACASIGVAIAGPDHAVPELLIRDADFAMYRAKQDGGGRFELFDKQLEVHVASLQERERELRQVLEKRLFEIWYQPIFRLQTGKLEGFESVLCWRRADGLVASLGDMLPLAEETGLSIGLGRETLEAVCRQQHNWTEVLSNAGLTLSVNLSPRQFYLPDLIAHVKKTLAASGADPARLLFEVEETALSENPSAALAIFERLLGCNVRLAVDNFGSGLAPLNHLVRLPIDVLKLDLSLTQAATQTGRQVAVLESLIQLGLRLGVQVVAQGIESPEQLDALIRLGCEMGQGPLLSPALQPSQAQELAEQGYWKLPPRA